MIGLATGDVIALVSALLTAVGLVAGAVRVLRAELREHRSVTERLSDRIHELAKAVAGALPRIEDHDRRITTIEREQRRRASHPERCPLDRYEEGAARRLSERD